MKYAAGCFRRFSFSLTPYSLSPLVPYIQNPSLLIEKATLPPLDLIGRYQEERASLNAEIDRVLAEITAKLGGVEL